MKKFDILIKNGRIWDGIQFLSNASDIAVKDGCIAEIGILQTQSAEHIFDARGVIIAPGFVDIHVHMKGCSSDAFGISIEPVCFPFGVTTAVDASADEEYTDGLFTNMWLNSYVFVNSSIKNNDVDLAKTERLIKSYGKRVIGIKVFFDATISEIKDTKPLSKICEYAHTKGLKVMVHSTGSPVTMSEVFDVLSNGDICSHIFHGGQNNVADDDFYSLKRGMEKGIIIDMGMAGGVHTDFSIAEQAIKIGLLPNTISTDITKKSAFVRGGNYGMTMAMSIMRELGMSEEKIFAAVTRSAAEAIGQENMCGGLNVGHRADITVINYEKNGFDITDRTGNRVKSEYGYRCLLTIANGQVVYRSNI